MKPFQVQLQSAYFSMLQTIRGAKANSSEMTKEIESIVVQKNITYARRYVLLIQFQNRRNCREEQKKRTKKGKRRV